MRKRPPSKRKLKPPRCPYCGTASVFLPTSETIYHGRDFGPVYACLPCGAWVGCHRGSNRPLGRLANAALRRAKIRAHDAFDRTWRSRYERKHRTDPGYTLARARASRYKRLTELLGIPREQCHIGLFDVDQCARVVELCRNGALDA